MHVLIARLAQDRCFFLVNYMLKLVYELLPEFPNGTLTGTQLQRLAAAAWHSTGREASTESVASLVRRVHLPGLLHIGPCLGRQWTEQRRVATERAAKRTL